MSDVVSHYVVIYCYGKSRPNSSKFTLQCVDLEHKISSWVSNYKGYQNTHVRIKFASTKKVIESERTLTFGNCSTTFINAMHVHAPIIIFAPAWYFLFILKVRINNIEDGFVTSKYCHEILSVCVSILVLNKSHLELYNIWAGICTQINTESLCVYDPPLRERAIL